MAIHGYTAVEEVVLIAEELTPLYIRTLLSTWAIIRENG